MNSPGLTTISFPSLTSTPLFSEAVNKAKKRELPVCFYHTGEHFSKMHKRGSVNRGNAMEAYAAHVLVGSIALMLFKPILRHFA